MFWVTVAGPSDKREDVSRVNGRRCVHARKKGRLTSRSKQVLDDVVSLGGNQLAEIVRVSGETLLLEAQRRVEQTKPVAEQQHLSH
jgi:cytoplasmic iron level regulating protein YaaA (DUF328/UPF0246 family)